MVTWHNKSENNSEDQDVKHLVWESATPSQVDVLFGYVKVSSRNTNQWFYPPEDLLNSLCLQYSGEWNAIDGPDIYEHLLSIDGSTKLSSQGTHLDIPSHPF
jgi:hypothetical protein